ncbi:MAG: hypothetical protein J0I77_15055 [Rudaea sp.]|uniref:DUF6159 family protein n=1 Tax=unclassified Rudaea TaxID=2627037 RepID=UPI0010F96F7C|nr:MULTISPECIES: DUF6159 family protein [unclassified Rudaea]MBN8887038.1 hypothetical protein [Rudaea sp.]MBR0345935.1 hypothetical protein [Rudaea sp.]
MFEKLSRSWILVKASAAVLKEDKKLLVYPALSAVCTVIVAASFFVPAAFAGVFTRNMGDHLTPGRALLLFAFYLVQYSVIIFFNSALVAAALIRLRGGEPTLADGFNAAKARLPAILGYAAIAATVGMILRSLQERAGFIGRWVIGLIGMAWSLATFLVVPILVNSDVGPVDAIKHSAELLKRTWGENLLGNVGIGVVFGLLSVVVVLVGVLLVIPAIGSQSAVAIGAVCALIVLAVILIALVQSALQGIYAAAIYRYAEEGATSPGFDQALIANAFQPKQQDGIFRNR